MKNSKKILLVEDDKGLLQNLREHLADAGFTVKAAASGTEALKIAAKTGALDLLLTDVMLPDLNGIELAKKLLDRQPDLKIAFMSGYLRPSLTNPDGPETPPPPFLQKPFTSRTLVVFARRCLFGEEAEPHAQDTPLSQK